MDATGQGMDATYGATSSNAHLVGVPRDWRLSPRSEMAQLRLDPGTGERVVHGAVCAGFIAVMYSETIWKATTEAGNSATIIVSAWCAIAALAATLLVTWGLPQLSPQGTRSSTLALLGIMLVAVVIWLVAWVDFITFTRDSDTPFSPGKHSYFHTLWGARLAAVPLYALAVCASTMRFHGGGFRNTSCAAVLWITGFGTWVVLVMASLGELVEESDGNISDSGVTSTDIAQTFSGGLLVSLVMFLVIVLCQHYGTFHRVYLLGVVLGVSMTALYEIKRVTAEDLSGDGRLEFETDTDIMLRAAMFVVSAVVAWGAIYTDGQTD
eukprot:TRINITY_DN3415_c0_g5_i2.p1 TRINITY_DN3415_c0_g5~~TRINITY_DN3415_c0_g5_i2.p1  ORF type:complete len:358 (+),score=32.15 TRINITY_DN3415_c0_g5_i2:104-1075(+)